MSTLAEKIAGALPDHQCIVALVGDGSLSCQCGHPLGRTSGDIEGRHDRHRAEVVAAVVAEWLGTDLDLLTLAEDEHGMRRFGAGLLVALAAEAVKGADA